MAIRNATATFENKRGLLLELFMARLSRDSHTHRTTVDVPSNNNNKKGAVGPLYLLSLLLPLFNPRKTKNSKKEKEHKDYNNNSSYRVKS